MIRECPNGLILFGQLGRSKSIAADKQGFKIPLATSSIIKKFRGLI